MQAFFNMAMAIGLLPTKGIALPFFSYGGSSVIMTLVMMGIILNMAAVDNTQNNLREDITNYKTGINNRMNKRFLIASGGTGGISTRAWLLAKNSEDRVFRSVCGAQKRSRRPNTGHA